MFLLFSYFYLALSVRSKITLTLPPPPYVSRLSDHTVIQHCLFCNCYSSENTFCAKLYSFQNMTLSLSQKTDTFPIAVASANMVPNSGRTYRTSVKNSKVFLVIFPVIPVSFAISRIDCQAPLITSV